MLAQAVPLLHTSKQEPPRGTALTQAGLAGFAACRQDIKLLASSWRKQP